MTRPATPPTEKQIAILEAAFARFTQYGYRRTSMEDLAEAAGISRPALYTHFRNKEDIFRALARRIQEQTLEAARAAAGAGGTIEDRIRGVLEAKLGSFFDLVQQSAHGRELLDENSRVCGDISAEYQRKYLKLLERLIVEGAASGALAPARVGVRPAAAADLIVASAQGLELAGPAASTPQNYRRRLAQLVRVFVAGLGGTPAV